GYEGSYDRVAAFSRQWKVGQMERVKSASKSTSTILQRHFLPQVFPDMTAEFVVLLSGIDRRVTDRHSNDIALHHVSIAGQSILCRRED
ncbi:hypothetical protein ACIPHN_11130, partial [Herbaspirillum sp. NPDC087042]